jgi:hypothetical protein
MKLYEISNSRLAFLEAIESGEITEDAIADTLAGIDGEFDDKADDIACFIKSLLSDKQAIKAEIDILADRADAKQHKADKLIDYLFQQFKLAGKTKVETARNIIMVKKCPVSVQIGNTESFVLWAKGNAADLLTFKEPAPDKKAIKQALQNGDIIPGAFLENNEKLAIK